MKNELIKFFLDWVNNYLSPAKMANDYGITESQCKKLIEVGRELCNAEIEIKKKKLNINQN